MNPAHHRHVRAIDGNRLRYVCGCINEIHEPSGVLHSVAKCGDHRAEQKEAGKLGREYYESMGVFENGIPQCGRYIAQIEEALGEFGLAPRPGDFAVEIGCGISPYAMRLMDLNYTYLGIEPSVWAAQWMANVYRSARAVIAVGSFPPSEGKTLDPESVPMILAAHSLEHLADAPGAIETCARILEPDGQFWIIVPNDEDPLNPDHLWTFSESTLRSCLEAAGLVVEKLAIRKYIERESFLYCRARKPS